jgi:hypothetical protein
MCFLAIREVPEFVVETELELVDEAILNTVERSKPII